ncbi:MAG: cytochrome c biosis protein CcmG, thiol:disulfide interchange protein DsbE [Acidimicrobiaceae bacterium]|nr:cytochrome c biosis protein CcmG, thiol:disulfide interchange protein DsbE [Acidimicrobiaceae bacterium]
MTAAVHEQSGPVDDRPRRRTALYAAVAVGLTIALFVGVLATRKPAADRVAPSRLIGRPAPDVSGPGLDGSRFALSAQQGKYVLVNFFATWCIPCVQEHPQLRLFFERHQAAGDAAVVSVVYRDEPADVRRFFDERGGGWPVVEDEAAKVDWGVRGVPESFLVSPDGIVLTRVVGGVSDVGLERLLAQADRALRGGRP